MLFLIMVSLDEKVIWFNFINGDKSCFEQLYYTNLDRLSNYGLRLHQDVNLVQESIQDLFVKLWQDRANLSIPESPKYYLIKALRNCIYNKLTKVNKEVYVCSENDILAFEFDIQQEPSDYNKELIKKLNGRFNHQTKGSCIPFLSRRIR